MVMLLPVLMFTVGISLLLKCASKSRMKALKQHFPTNRDLEPARLAHLKLGAERMFSHQQAAPEIAVDMDGKPVVPVPDEPTASTSEWTGV